MIDITIGTCRTGNGQIGHQRDGRHSVSALVEADFRSERKAREVDGTIRQEGIATQTHLHAIEETVAQEGIAEGVATLVAIAIVLHTLLPLEDTPIDHRRAC